MTTFSHDGGMPFAVRGDLDDPASTLLKIRMLQAFERGAARYPVYRRLRAAVRRSLEDVFDDLALRSGLIAQRLDESTLLLDGAGVFVRARGARKTNYSSCIFDLWVESLDRLEEVRISLLQLAGEQLSHERMFTIDWHFSSGHLGLSSVAFEEMAEEALIDEAYPGLGEPVAAFIDRYVRATETVLILQGPPGTGKTRLVRAILAALSVRKGDAAKVLYTADKRTLENDEIFAEFITGSHDAFVVEDADHLLQARSNGNVDLHRFLAITDGVVRAQGRRIVFTTNLPNVSDIDDALLRPGRCFAVVKTRAHTRAEAVAFLEKLREPTSLGVDVGALLPPTLRCATLAELYRLGAMRTES